MLASSADLASVRTAASARARYFAEHVALEVDGVAGFQRVQIRVRPGERDDLDVEPMRRPTPATVRLMPLTAIDPFRTMYRGELRRESHRQPVRIAILRGSRRWLPVASTWP